MGRIIKKFSVSQNIRLLVVMQVFIALALFSIILFAYFSFYKASKSSVSIHGKLILDDVCERLSTHIVTSSEILDSAANTIDFMIEENVPKEKIHKYLRELSDDNKEKFAPDYKGLYGYIDGEYMDGFEGDSKKRRKTDFRAPVHRRKDEESRIFNSKASERQKERHRNRRSDEGNPGHHQKHRRLEKFNEFHTRLEIVRCGTFGPKTNRKLLFRQRRSFRAQKNRKRSNRKGPRIIRHNVQISSMLRILKASSRRMVFRRRDSYTLADD